MSQQKPQNSEIKAFIEAIYEDAPLEEHIHCIEAVPYWRYWYCSHEKKHYVWTDKRQMVVPWAWGPPQWTGDTDEQLRAFLAVKWVPEFKKRERLGRTRW